MKMNGNNPSSDYVYGGIAYGIAGINKYTWRCLPGSSRKLEGASTYGGCFQWPIMTDVVQYSVSYDTSCVVRSDGSNQCW